MAFVSLGNLSYVNHHMLPIIFTKINCNTISIATDNDSESDTVQVTRPRKRFPKIA